MSGCVEFQSSMTGSTREGPLKPPEDSAPLPACATTSSSSSSSSSRSTCSDRHPLDREEASMQSPRRQQARLRQKMMTPVRPPSGQPIQLTPLWEHVVRTQRFPSEVDTRETFDEIAVRLRDPEWEVRQHALRVLVDVLPTLDVGALDEAMMPILTELINNLGHLAPAVRKGALDTLRVYLVCSKRKEEIVTRVLDEGLTRADALDNFQTNVTLGVILSTPSLLFPSSSSPRPSKEMLRQAIGALAMRLIQQAHQEASVRSLVKIHEILGDEEFDSYLRELDANAKRDYEVLCDVYQVKPSEGRKRSGRKSKRKKDVAKIGQWNNDGEENEAERRKNELNKNWEPENECHPQEDEENGVETLINAPMPPARIVLETEIKFNEETAITMTILEEKDADSEDDDEELGSGDELARDEEIVLEVRNDVEETKDDDDGGDVDSKNAWIERRKTPRRVHFGGEVVKLRTPDSDDSEMIRSEAPQTRIPLPISPTTKMPEIRPRRSFSNPSSPNVAKSRPRRSRSVSSSPKREFYTHDASLSPKKSILTRSTPTVVVQTDAERIDTSSCREIVEKKVDQLFGKEEDDRGWAFEVCDTDPPDDPETDKSERKNSSNGRNPREVTRPKRSSARTKGEVTNVSEVAVNEVKEDVKVEKVQPLGRSEAVRTSPESFAGAKEETEERKAVVDPKETNRKDPREVEEKPMSSGEAKPTESQRRSPRSPKKLVFESFPRKERNYILMELSSPVKTDARKTGDSEAISDDRQLPGESVNDVGLSRENSTKGTVDNHLLQVPSGVSKAETNLGDKNEKATKPGEKREKDPGMAEETVEEIPKKENLVESSSPSPIPKFRESSWEELGLVDQEVLNDLHNKDDWRARVRGLERVASALRTSSALIAIESRLGSLLQAVLGGERSCRVAAAGMAVARVVVAGVSEEALRRRLPQVAWGLARQGGPNAAQLARVAMLRLRPALLLEQLLQPHCIKARNAKTRENALQLLIFSLVTFPSTEFKVENVANKVASMVADRRRRVRQAALDTLAVLAQIYEPEEVMQAGKLAAKGQQDGDAMLAAIRARLARKSLPMVSADGLVVYGLQISPTVQIATGPDVDWIVAGSGSVSPGTGRTRGQIIATTTRQQEKVANSRNESMKNLSNSKGPNFVAVGVGLEPKNEQHQPLAWQLVQQPCAQDESHRIKEKLWEPENRENNSSGKYLEATKSRLTGSLRYYRSASDRLGDSFESDATPIFLLDDKDVIMKQRRTEENFHRRMDEIYAERTGIGPAAQDLTGNRLESRIPVPQSREREINGRDSRIGTSYPRTRNQEENNLENWSASSRGSEASRPRSIRRNNDRLRSDVSAQRYQRLARDSTPERLSTTRDTYRSIYQQRRGYADGNVYREVQTAPTTTSYDVSRRRQSLRDSEVASRVLLVPQESRRVSTEVQTSSNDSRSRRLANGGSAADGYRLPNPSVTNGDKSAVVEEENNEINKRHFSVQTNPYRIQNLSDRSTQFPARSSNGPSETSSNDSSNASGEDVRPEKEKKVESDRECVMDSFVASEPEMLRCSSSQSPLPEKSFDVITHETNPSRRNSIEYGISGNEGLSNAIVAYSNEEYETDKGSSTDDASVLPEVQLSQGKFVETPVHGEADDDDDEDDDSSSDVEERSTRNAATSFVSNESNSSDRESLSKVSNESPASNESRDIVDATCSNSGKSPSRADSVYALRSIEAVVYDNSRSSTDENDGPDPAVAFVREYPSEVSMEDGAKDDVVSAEARNNSSSVTEAFFQESQEQRIPMEDETGALTNAVSILVAGARPHTPRDASEPEKEASFEPLDFRQQREITAIASSAVTKIAATSTRELVEIARSESPKKPSFTALPDVSTTIPQDFSRESTTMTTAHGKINRASSSAKESAATVPEIIVSQSVATENNEALRRVATSRVPRIRQKTRMNLARVAPMPAAPSNNDKTPSKSKSIAQQCFTQLESNDWEVAMKGLKALSQIARQHPEQLDSCAPGTTLGRLLGRHVRNLRSQVSRAACLAAGDVFGSQARCIDQDLDDIAGPLLHRTADTNKFLRADSNEALDRMVEHLPPNKTIGVIVHRGATHQNAIVRAATARLLASIVDRLGPDWAMSLPRDVREKLIATGAKLLMDGNLDARNHAKRMIRKLARCEGFRKALTDSVPEATLRHIDKTLKSL